MRRLVPDVFLLVGTGLITGGLWTWFGRGPALIVLGVLLVFVGLRLESENQRGGLG